MKKSYLMLAAAAALFAACTSDDLPAEKQIAAQEAGDGAVVFDAYQSRGTTRAGAEGTMNLSLLQDPGAGFGVFSYYTNNEGYSDLALPDFMYNQKVTYTSGWTYEPIKYWPNEFGTNAESERVDYLTFFAYAPYVASDPKTGKLNEKDDFGIVGLTRNTKQGDPLVKYVVNFDPAKIVDLCWGVAAADFTETVSTEPLNDIKQNCPYIDVIKPKTNSKIKFDFKHALTQLNVQIDTDVDTESHAGGEADNKTRIYVRSVTFEGFTDRGTLNLNSKWTAENTTPTWYDLSGSGNLSTTPVTIYDQRYDGREGVENVTAPAESPVGLNSKIIQSKPYTATVTPLSLATDAGEPGVTHTPVNLFNTTDATTSILVIPNNQPMKVKVVYDVETYDPSLPEFLSDGKTHGKSVENAITKEIKLSSGDAMKLASGKKYIVKLHLGLTSVKFDASVAAWDDTTPVEANTDLPINSGVTAEAGGTPAAISINAAGESGIFLATGFNGGATPENVTPEFSGTGFTATLTPGTATPATADGTLGIRYVIAANTTVKQVSGIIKATGATSSKVATLNVTQAPAALGLTVTGDAIVAVKKVITLGATATIATNDFANATWTVVRNRGGVSKTLEKNATPSADTYNIAEIAGSPITARVTLGADAQAGDIYTITVQAGDAEAETVTVTVPKQAATIAFETPTPANPSTFTAGNYDLGDDVLTNAASLADASAAALAANAANGGTIAYTVSDDTYFSITTGGVLKFKAGWNPGDSRSVTVTATVTPGANYTYNTPSVSYTITVTTNP